MPSPPDDFLLRSADGRYGLQLPGPCVLRTLAYCREAGMRETGGILVGHYTDTLDCAVVTEVSGPPPDSRRAHNRFYRGKAGLQQWLAALWDEKGQYYLGEWHYHPLGLPEPSPQDRRQMADIAAAPDYHCPEPLLVLVGGDPLLSEWKIGAYVHASGAALVPIL